MIKHEETCALIGILKIKNLKNVEGDTDAFIKNRDT